MYIHIEIILINSAVQKKSISTHLQCPCQVRRNLVIYNRCISCVEAAWTWALQLLEELEVPKSGGIRASR